MNWFVAVMTFIAFLQSGCMKSFEATPTTQTAKGDLDSVYVADESAYNVPGGAWCLVTNDKKQMLAMYTVTQSLTGWDIPGGIADSDHVAQVASFETFRETGQKVVAGEEIWPNILSCKCVDGCLTEDKLSDSSGKGEISELHWMSLNEIQDIARFRFGKTGSEVFDYISSLPGNAVMSDETSLRVLEADTKEDYAILDTESKDIQIKALDACGCSIGTMGWSRELARCNPGSTTDTDEINACQQGRRLTFNNTANMRDACGCVTGSGWSRALVRCNVGSQTDTDEIKACNEGRRLTLNTATVNANNVVVNPGFNNGVVVNPGFNNGIVANNIDSCGCTIGANGWSRTYIRCNPGSVTDGEELNACRQGRRLTLNGSMFVGNVNPGFNNGVVVNPGFNNGVVVNPGFNNGVVNPVFNGQADPCGCIIGVSGWSRQFYRCNNGSVTDNEEIIACQQGRRLSLNNNVNNPGFNNNGTRDACGCVVGVNGWSRQFYRCNAGSVTDNDERIACSQGRRLGL